MKKYIRITALSIALLFCVSLLLPSCAKADHLEVVSEDFPKLRYLQAGEYDEEEIRSSFDIDVNMHYKHAYMVSEKDGKLCVSEGIDYKIQSARKISCDNGYFVSVNIGEFDSWVEYYDYRMGCFDDYPTPEGQLVTNNLPFDFVEIDRRKMYLITEEYDHDSDSNWEPDFDTVLFKLWLPDLNSQWQWEEMPNTIDGWMRASFYHQESGILYLVTSVGLFALAPNGVVTSYPVPGDGLWTYMNHISVVVIDDMIYVGSYFGIYAQSVDGGESTWYPLTPY